MSSEQAPSGVELATAPPSTSSGPSYHYTLGGDTMDADQTGRTNPGAVLGNPTPASPNNQLRAQSSAIAPGHSMQGTQVTSLAKQPSKQVASQQELQMEAGRQNYDAYMRRLHSLWRDNVDLSISYRDLAYDITVPVTDPGVPNLAKSLLNFFTLKGLRTPSKQFLALQPTFWACI